MLKKLLSPSKGAYESHLLNLTLGIGAMLALTSPSFAQSTIIYQRTTTYDNYTHPISPPGGQSLFPPKTNLFDLNPTNTLFSNNRSNNILFPEVRVYRRPHIRQYVNDSTLVNPVLVNPNIKNSTIINPIIINNPQRRRQPRKGSVFMYSLP